MVGAVLGALIGAARTLSTPLPTAGEAAAPQVCPSLPDAHITVRLTVHSAVPATYDVAVSVTLPASDSAVADLVRDPESWDAATARACLLGPPVS